MKIIKRSLICGETKNKKKYICVERKKVETFSKYAVHKKFEQIKTPQAASFSKMMLTADDVGKPSSRCLPWDLVMR